MSSQGELSSWKREHMHVKASVGSRTSGHPGVVQHPENVANSSLVSKSLMLTLKSPLRSPSAKQPSSTPGPWALLLPPSLASVCRYGEFQETLSRLCFVGTVGLYSPILALHRHRWTCHGFPVLVNSISIIAESTLDQPK